MTLQNEKFEELISQQLARELEPQRGKAAAAFRAHIAAEAAQHQAASRAAPAAGGSKDPHSWARRDVSRRGILFWTAGPAAIAATLALAVTLHFTGPGGQTVPTQRDTFVAKGSNSLLDGRSPSNTIADPEDGGGAPAAVPGFEQIQPGEVMILPNPSRSFGPPAIRTTSYIEPVGHAYPLNPPSAAQNPNHMPGQP